MSVQEPITAAAAAQLEPEMAAGLAVVEAKQHIARLLDHQAGLLVMTMSDRVGTQLIVDAKSVADAVDWDLDEPIRRVWDPPRGPEVSALVLSGYVELVESTEVVVVARREDDAEADEIVVHVPMRLVSVDQRHLLEAGAHVEWALTQIAHDDGTVLTRSRLHLIQPQELSNDEIGEIERRAADFDIVLPDHVGA